MTTDHQIIMRHAQSCRARCRMELDLVHLLMDEAKKIGYTLQESEEGKTDDLLGLLFDLDEANIIVKDATGKEIGWILLVFGNDGWDLVSDYTVNLETFLKPLSDLSDKMQKNGGV